MTPRLSLLLSIAVAYSFVSPLDAVAQNGIAFDSVTFTQAWAGTDDNARMIEYTAEGESVESWTRMITFQCHPSASEVKQVSGPYFEARKKLVAMRPEASTNETENVEDMNLVLFLGAPGQTEHIEFILARFIRGNEPGVFAAIYSHRFPASTNVDVSLAIKNKDRWIKELSAIPLQRIATSCNETGDKQQ